MTRTRGLVLAVVVVVLAGGASAALALRAGSSAVLRTVVLAGNPTGVAVDALNGQTLVAAGDPADAASFYQTGGSGHVSIIATGSGRVLHTVSIGAGAATLALDERDGRALALNSQDGTVSVLDLRSGAVLRTVGVGSFPRSIAVDPQTGRAFVVNSGDGTVSMLDARRGVVLRAIRLATSSSSFYTSSFLGSVTVDARDGRVFVGGRGVVYVLDARSGARLRTIPLGQGAGFGGTYMAADARTGYLFVAARTGLSIVDGRSGRLLHQVAMTWLPTALALDAQRGRVYVATLTLSAATTPSRPRRGFTSGNGGRFTYRGGGGFGFGRGYLAGPGEVQVLDARSGALLRVIPVGIVPGAIAVDERTGHVVVVTRGGRVTTPDPWSWVPDGVRHWLPFLSAPARTRTVSASLSVLDATA